MSDVVVIIPARWGSTRFPAKALADDTGKPMIQHVWERAAAARRASRIAVATDDERIADAARSFGGEAVLTGEHPNGTSRLDEAAERMRLPDGAVIVNVQGDEPEIEPALIDAVAGELETSGASIATAASPIDPAEASDPNLVKVVRRLDGCALYFSRAAIPHGDAAPLRHLGIYAYRRAFLREYVRLNQTPLEQAERLEQLRALEHAHDIAVALVEHGSSGIDTPEQYRAFVERWRASHSA